MPSAESASPRSCSGAGTIQRDCSRSCAALGLKKLRPFFFEHGQCIDFQARACISRAELAGRFQLAAGVALLVVPGGPRPCQRIGVVSGGAGGELKTAAAEEVETFVTGEGPHWTYALAEELGLNVLYGGHYATETFDVKALALRLSSRFRIPWQFIDHPTGLQPFPLWLRLVAFYS